MWLAVPPGRGPRQLRVWADTAAAALAVPMRKLVYHCHAIAMPVTSSHYDISLCSTSEYYMYCMYSVLLVFVSVCTIVQIQMYLWVYTLNVWIFFPILEHFCPCLVQIAQIGLNLPTWGLILPRIPPPTLILYSAITHPLLGYVHTQNIHYQTPKHPFFLAWTLGKLDPNWAKYLKCGQSFPRSGQFFLFIYIECHEWYSATCT